MTTPASGQIGISDLAIEWGFAFSFVNLSTQSFLDAVGHAAPIGLSEMHNKTKPVAPSPGPTPAPAPSPVPTPVVFRYVMVPGTLQVDDKVFRMGYDPTQGFGSIDTTAFPFGTSLLSLVAEINGNSHVDIVTLSTTGSHLQLGAFSQLNINGTLFFPGDASHVIANGGGTTFWIWSNRTYNFSPGVSTVISVTQA